MDTGSAVDNIMELPCEVEDAEEPKVRIKGVSDGKVFQKGCKPTAFQLQDKTGEWVEYFSQNTEYVQAEHHQVLIGLPQLRRMRALVDCFSQTVFVPNRNGTRFHEFDIRCKARFPCKCQEKCDHEIREVTANIARPTEDSDKDLMVSSDPASSYIAKKFAGSRFIPRPAATLRNCRGILTDSTWSQAVDDEANAAERNRQAHEYCVKLAVLDAMREDIRQENRRLGWKRARRIKAETMIAIAEACETKGQSQSGGDVNEQSHAGVQQPAVASLQSRDGEKIESRKNGRSSERTASQPALQKQTLKRKLAKLTPKQMNLNRKPPHTAATRFVRCVVP